MTQNNTDGYLGQNPGPPIAKHLLTATYLANAVSLFRQRSHKFNPKTIRAKENVDDSITQSSFLGSETTATNNSIVFLTNST